MVKKKRRKKVSKKRTRVKSKSMPVTKRKFNLVVRNLILFAVMAVLSFILYSFLENDVFKNLFSLLAMVFGFTATAFLIILLIFFILKIMRK